MLENFLGWLTATGTEGVFRLSANAAVVEELVGRFDRGEPVDFDAPLVLTTSSGKSPAVIDAHVVAGLLKRWFRELPEPLCTTEMYDMWMAAASIKDEPTKLQQVKKVLSFVPLSNQILIKYLASFLRSFAVFADETKMTSKNLSICFAPNLLRAPDTIGLADQMEESPIATGLLIMFIEKFDNVFDSTVGIATPFAEGLSKSSLTANLLPPPPTAAPAASKGPAPPPNKPSPKFTTKKTGFRTAGQSTSNDAPSSPSISPLALSGSGFPKAPSFPQLSSNVSPNNSSPVMPSNSSPSQSGFHMSSHRGSTGTPPQLSPDTAALPPPIASFPPLSPTSSSSSPDNHSALPSSLPPPPVGPKPLNKNRLKRSGKKEDDISDGTTSPRDVSPTRSSPPPLLGDPTQNGASSSPSASGPSSGTSTPLTSSAPRLPPPRPSSNPPTFV